MKTDKTIRCTPGSAGTRTARRAAATALMLGLVAGTAGARTDFTSRDGGPSEAQMLARGDAGLPGMAFVRPVLGGVLYRAGFEGGDKAHTGLSDAQRQALCEAGFSGVRYIDFGSKTRFGKTSCGSNSLEYKKGSSGSTRDIMKDIHSVIENPGEGPMLVHCMWGVHSSGAVSAMALVQFCGWPEERAKAYWEKGRNNAPCGSGGCGEWIDGKFAGFKVDPSLRISAEQQKRICPR
jgi:hypothetical protein